MHNIGSRIKEIRSKRGLTQRELAARISKSVSAISGYESNAQTPPTDVLISIAQVLHVPITYFIDINDKDSVSLRSLSQEQRDFMDLLFQEFTSPTNSESLSRQQLELVRKLMLIFSQ